MGERGRRRRLFVGVALDDCARAACARVSDELRTAGFAAKYETSEKLHVTLAFLGFVESSRFDEIASALVAAARSRPFTVTLDKLGAFPHERRPRVVYIGAREQGAPFRALAAIVRAEFEALGLRFTNDVVAHVTVARVKESKRPLPPIEFAPISLHVNALALFESLPDPANATSRYEVVATAQL